jgi:hypothetical protein
MEWKLFETFRSPVGRGAPLRPSNRRLDFFEGEPSHLEVAICVFGQPNCFHLLKGRLLIGFHSPPVTRNPLLLLCDRAQPENSTISSNFRAFWFAGRPTCKALRACLRHPISPPPSDSVRPYAFPKSPRSGKYFDLRLPFGASPHGPTCGCSYSRAAQPSVSRPGP